MLEKLRQANTARNKVWDPESLIDLSFRGVEFAGESGEVCNEIKKLVRERMGLRGSRTTLDKLAEELADTIICADLIAMHCGINLIEAVRKKFNATSEVQKLPVKL